jgi:hypothetical protein
MSRAEQKAAYYIAVAKAHRQTPEVKAVLSATARRYYAQHRAECLAREKLRYAAWPRERRAYSQQRNRARERGIEWLFNYETWRAIWGAKFSLRGRLPYQLCMARNGDTGPYAPNNVILTTNRENNHDQHIR